MDKFTELSNESICIKSAIAYWTLPVEKLPNSFISGIKHPDGFLCCDIHSPTSIDSLASLKEANANIYLHLYQLVGKTEVPDSKGIPDNLMHSKVYVFESIKGEIKIWIGSHNATMRAMTAINFECAIVFSTDKQSDVYRSVINHLHQIQNRSTEFNLNLTSYYRALQGGIGADGFIEVEDDSNTQLKSGESISIFGSVPEDYQQLKKVGKKLYLAVSNTNTGKEHFYCVTITQTGTMEGKGSKSITFSERRFAKRFNSQIPMLEGGSKKALPLNIYDQAIFFVTLQIVEPLPTNTEAIEAPPEKIWKDVDLIEYHRKKCFDKIYSIDYIQTGKYKIQEPINLEIVAKKEVMLFESTDNAEWSRAFTKLSLADKRALEKHPLIRKRIFL